MDTIYRALGQAPDWMLKIFLQKDYAKEEGGCKLFYLDSFCREHSQSVSAAIKSDEF